MSLTRQRQCLSRKDSGTHQAKAVSEPRRQWSTQGKGGVLAAKVVQTHTAMAAPWRRETAKGQGRHCLSHTGSGDAKHGAVLDVFGEERPRRFKKKAVPYLRLACTISSGWCEKRSRCSATASQPWGTPAGWQRKEMQRLSERTCFRRRCRTGACWPVNMLVFSAFSPPPPPAIARAARRAAALDWPAGMHSPWTSWVLDDQPGRCRGAEAAGRRLPTTDSTLFER